MINREEPCFYVCAYHGHQDSYALLAGPYATQEEALSKVSAVYKTATTIDKNAWVYEYGTIRLKHGRKDGSLNFELSKMENSNGTDQNKNPIFPRPQGVEESNPKRDRRTPKWSRAKSFTGRESVR